MSGCVVPDPSKLIRGATKVAEDLLKKPAANQPLPEVTQLIPQPTRDFHRELLESVAKRIEDNQKRVQDWNGWRYEVGDRVKTPTGQLLEITGRSWWEPKARKDGKPPSEMAMRNAGPRYFVKRADVAPDAEGYWQGDATADKLHAEGYELLNRNGIHLVPGMADGGLILRAAKGVGNYLDDFVKAVRKEASGAIGEPWYISRGEAILKDNPAVSEVYSPEALAYMTTYARPDAIEAMLPRTFHSLAFPLDEQASRDYINHYKDLIRAGEWVEPKAGLFNQWYLDKMASQPYRGFSSIPQLTARTSPNSMIPYIAEHEGRHRNYALQEIYGDRLAFPMWWHVSHGDDIIPRPLQRVKSQLGRHGNIDLPGNKRYAAGGWIDDGARIAKSAIGRLVSRLGNEAEVIPPKAEALRDVRGAWLPAPEGDNYSSRYLDTFIRKPLMWDAAPGEKRPFIDLATEIRRVVDEIEKNPQEAGKYFTKKANPSGRDRSPWGLNDNGVPHQPWHLSGVPTRFTNSGNPYWLNAGEAPVGMEDPAALAARFIPRLRQKAFDIELRHYKDMVYNGQIAKYMRYRMGSPNDDVRKGLDEGMNLYALAPWINDEEFARKQSARAAANRIEAKSPALGQTPFGRAFEDAIDSQISATPAKKRNLKSFGGAKLNDEQREFLGRLPDDVPVYQLKHADPYRFGAIFSHTLDALEARARLPKTHPNYLEPKDWTKLNFRQLMEIEDAYNAERARKAAEAKRPMAIPTGKVDIAHRYPSGYQWVNLRAKPDSFTPEELAQYAFKPDAFGRVSIIGPDGKEAFKVQGSVDFAKESLPSLLADDLTRRLVKNEGDNMGHCVGNYCEQVINGTTRIYSLRDPSGISHATAEVEVPRFGPPLIRQMKPAGNMWGSTVAKEKAGADRGGYRDRISSMMRDFVKTQGPWSTVLDTDVMGLLRGPTEFSRQLMGKTGIDPRYHSIDHTKVWEALGSEFASDAEWIDAARKLYPDSFKAEGGIVNPQRYNADPRAQMAHQAMQDSERTRDMALNALKQWPGDAFGWPADLLDMAASGVRHVASRLTSRELPPATPVAPTVRRKINEVTGFFSPKGEREISEMPEERESTALRYANPAAWGNIYGPISKAIGPQGLAAVSAGLVGLPGDFSGALAQVRNAKSPWMTHGDTLPYQLERLGQNKHPAVADWLERRVAPWAKNYLGSGSNDPVYQYLRDGNQIPGIDDFLLHYDVGATDTQAERAAIQEGRHHWMYGEPGTKPKINPATHEGAYEAWTDGLVDVVPASRYQNIHNTAVEVGVESPYPWIAQVPPDTPFTNLVETDALRSLGIGNTADALDTMLNTGALTPNKLRGMTLPETMAAASKHLAREKISAGEQEVLNARAKIAAAPAPKVFSGEGLSGVHEMTNAEQASLYVKASGVDSNLGEWTSKCKTGSSSLCTRDKDVAQSYLDNGTRIMVVTDGKGVPRAQLSIEPIELQGDELNDAFQELGYHKQMQALREASKTTEGKWAANYWLTNDSDEGMDVPVHLLDAAKKLFPEHFRSGRFILGEVKNRMQNGVVSDPTALKTLQQYIQKLGAEGIEMEPKAIYKFADMVDLSNSLDDNIRVYPRKELVDVLINKVGMAEKSAEDLVEAAGKNRDYTAGTILRSLIDEYYGH